MKKNIIFMFLCLLVITTTEAQEDFKFGKVSKDILTQAEHPIEKSAEAAVLHEKIRSYYNYNDDSGWAIIREVTKRLKIYSKKGLDRATFVVPLYVSGSSDERISGIKGITHNMVNGKAEAVKLKKEGIFREESNKYYENVKITLPEVKEGSVIDIQ